ncbi:MAG: serine hydrolase [Clostridiales Family XIII bacterium]|jgi:CubicO group peptidase (beta-lactamase class C family)|nr:serine hydrolase [Clostridiales Family XIII bacterium]
MAGSGQRYLEGIDDMISDAMKLMNVPGAAIVIVDNGEVVYQKAHGYADLENKIPLTGDHYIPIGSSSKAFTATAAAMLVADGALEFDKPIRDYIPWFELYDTFATKEATPRDLLCHRTGLPRHDILWLKWPELEREDLVRRLKHLQPNFSFRYKYQYNNLMFAALGYLIERVSGKKWEDFVVERIFGPLGIENYSFLIPDPIPSDTYAKLYTPDENGQNKANAPLQFEAMGPAGSINTPIGELAKWLKFNLEGGKAGGKGLLPAEIFAELQRPNIPYELLPFPTSGNVEVGYAFGWLVDQYRGHRKVAHGGNVEGGSADISFLPDDGIGVAIQTNADGSLFPMAFTLALYDRFLGVEREDDIFAYYDTSYKTAVGEMQGMFRAVLDTKIEGKPCSHDLGDYAGAYVNEGYGDIEVSLTDDGLKARLHGNVLDLEHLHYDTFTAELFKLIRPLNFHTAVTGDITSLDIALEPGVEPVIFAKKEK